MESILIVDDEIQVRELLKIFLESNGYRCELAANAKEAREQLAKDSFDLVLSDIYMPGESGVDLARYVKSAYPDTAVVIVSSADDPLKIKEVLDFNVYGYIVKPIECNCVFISVENALQRLKLEQGQKKYQHNLERIIQERTKKLAESECHLRDLVDKSIQGIITQKEQLHFLSELVNDIPYPLFFKDRKGVYKLWNSAYENLNGMKAEAAIGKTCYQVWPEEVAKEIEKQDKALFQNPGIQNYDIQIPDLHGNLRDMEVTKAVYIKQNGSIGGLIGLMKDVTEKKQLEAQLHQAQKLESIGQLAAGIAHEINTPTQYVGDNLRFLEDAFADLESVLQNYAKLLEAAKPDVRYQSLVEEVESVIESADLEYLEEEIPLAINQSLEGVERVAKIVRSMKEFSHPGIEEKIPMNLNKAIESTITVARNEWKYVAEMETHFDQTAPLVPGLPGELNQVFLNMIVNAAHAIEAVLPGNNNGRGKISISTLANDDSVEIRISDTGCGIPADIRHRIFDPFFTTKEVGKGTGQGLAIAHTVITDNHNGTITLESEEGKGTTFIIRLPLTDNVSMETNE